MSPHRFPPPFLKGCLFENAHPLYTLGTSFLYLCDLRIRYTLYSHTFIVRICNHASALLLYLGGAYRESLGVPFSLSLSDF